jgi:deoxyribodipyrimidine photo-lyase
MYAAVENKELKYGVYIFRRDLRIYDNIGLNELQKKVDIILPMYICDPKQICRSQENKNYYNEGAVQFICESLADLDFQIRYYNTEQHKNESFYLPENKSSLLFDHQLEMHHMNDINVAPETPHWDNTVDTLKNDIKKSQTTHLYLSLNSQPLGTTSSIEKKKLTKLTEHPCLRLFLGDPCTVLEKVILTFTRNKIKQENIFFSFQEDYSLFSKKRDSLMKQTITRNGCQFIKSSDDYSLVRYEYDANELIFLFENFYNKVKNTAVAKPFSEKFCFLNSTYIFDGEMDIQFLWFTDSGEKMTNLFCTYNPHIVLTGGRATAIEKLNEYETKYYVKIHDTNSKISLMKKAQRKGLCISAHLNSGCVSVREVFFYIKNRMYDSQLLRNLYLRDFYIYASQNMPNATQFRHMNSDIDKMPWLNKKEEWWLLMSSQTGFLMIDAAMMEMKTTGYLQYNLRYLLGIFWTRYMLINNFHPKYGSQVGFSKYCVDAIGVLQNKYNHHYLTEFDYLEDESKNLKPNFRKKVDVSNNNIKLYDPDCTYIKKWLPHLIIVPSKDLYGWDKSQSLKYLSIHPPPMFSHSERHQLWIDMCFKLQFKKIN